MRQQCVNVTQVCQSTLQSALIAVKVDRRIVFTASLGSETIPVPQLGVFLQVIRPREPNINGVSTRHAHLGNGSTWVAYHNKLPPSW